MVGDEGWFFINGDFVSKLDLRELSEPGQVVVIASYYSEDEVEGEQTEFRDFKVWRWHPSLADLP